MKKILFIVLASMMAINFAGSYSKDKVTGEDLKNKPKVESFDGKDKEQQKLNTCIIYHFKKKFMPHVQL